MQQTPEIGSLLDVGASQSTLMPLFSESKVAAMNLVTDEVGVEEDRQQQSRLA